MKKKNNRIKTEEKAKVYVDMQSKKFDPNGSWTGTPNDKDEKPIQDADDL